MSQKILKELALFLAVVMILTGMPISVQAAADPAFQTTYSTFMKIVPIRAFMISRSIMCRKATY